MEYVYGRSYRTFLNQMLSDSLDQVEFQQNTQVFYDWKLAIDASKLAPDFITFNPPIPTLDKGKIKPKSQPQEFSFQLEDKYTHFHYL